MRPRAIVATAAVGVLAAALWWRRNPSACPYGQRFWVEAPHPLITRERLLEVLDPTPGERLLEIGPGTGYYSAELATWVGEDGRLDLLDLQQRFLDHTLGRLGERGLSNAVATCADATDLPYEDASFDAVVMVAVLGETPDRERTLAEVARVLRPGGRLVVGELFGDPHFTSTGSLRRLGARVGLRFDARSGPWVGFFARLVADPDSSVDDRHHA